MSIHTLYEILLPVSTPECLTAARLAVVRLRSTFGGGTTTWSDLGGACTHGVWFDRDEAKSSMEPTAPANQPIRQERDSHWLFTAAGGYLSDPLVLDQYLGRFESMVYSEYRSIAGAYQKEIWVSASTVRVVGAPPREHPGDLLLAARLAYQRMRSG